MTDDWLAQVRKRVEAASPAPWVVVGDYERGGLGVEHPEERGKPGYAVIYARGSYMPPLAIDAVFIAHARQDVTRLLACAEALDELLRLKDGPRDDHYRATKEAAWERARKARDGAS